MGRPSVFKERGVTVWIDDIDVRPGESLRGALESGVRGSDVLVSLVDPEYPAKPNLFFEIGSRQEWRLQAKLPTLPTFYGIFIHVSE